MGTPTLRATRLRATRLRATTFCATPPGAALAARAWGPSSESCAVAGRSMGQNATPHPATAMECRKCLESTEVRDDEVPVHPREHWRGCRVLVRRVAQQLVLPLRARSRRSALAFRLRSVQVRAAPERTTK